MPFRIYFTIGISIALYWVLKWTFGDRKKKFNEGKNIICWGIVFIFFLPLDIGITYFGRKIPGSIFERVTYEGVFSANLYPNNQKEFSIPVKVYVSAYVDEWDGNDYEGQTEHKKRYCVKYIVTKTGKIIPFDSVSEPFIELKRISSVTDIYGNWWGIEFADLPNF